MHTQSQFLPAATDAPAVNGANGAPQPKVAFAFNTEQLTEAIQNFRTSLRDWRVYADLEIKVLIQ